MSEHEHWPNEGFSTYEDSPFSRGGVEFVTPALVENTEICGPIVLNLYGSSTDEEIFWFVTLWRYDADDGEHMLTRGWLRGSQRKLDEDKSKPWQPVHTHDERQPLTPGEIYEFNIEVRPYGILLKAGERIGVKIRGADDEIPDAFIETIAQGQITRPQASHVSVHHNADQPSHLLLPITRGNRIGTFISGGILPPLAGH